MIDAMGLLNLVRKVILRTSSTALSTEQHVEQSKKMIESGKERLELLAAQNELYDLRIKRLERKSRDVRSHR